MQQMVKRLVLGSLVMTVTACTTALPPARTPALGMPFNEEIKTRYLALADANRRAVDWDYFHFRKKAESALLGDLVLPDEVDARAVPVAVQPEALQLRAKLLDVLDRGARVSEPAAAADAQANFDCWLEELDNSEGAVPASQCKERLVAGLEQIERGLIQPDAVYLVYFDTGSSTLQQAEMAAIERAAEAADLLKPARVRVVGYADRTGPATLNRQLSKARADAVAKALIAKGVPADTVRTSGDGETSDQVYAEGNRRVEIFFDNS
jgi:OOP family OmpA-OmpF porin